ncbi:MAG TPA: peptidoglycan-associated lipoprotein Pal [Acetobacteraceae bacterium]|nr:peptidoglycan-associated lipoprotein Pal [Acetobacteraceae bacterium]
MKASTISCLAAAAMLAACSSGNTGANSTGSGAGGTMGANGTGTAGAGAYGSGHAAPGSEEDLVQNVGDRIYFATDRSSLDDQARATLDRQAGWLQQYPAVNIWVAGNCDERGTEEYNLALGQRRANADRDYLVAHGIAQSRIETISYGKARPVDAGASPDAWAKNRNAITSVR